MVTKFFEEEPVVTVTVEDVVKPSPDSNFLFTVTFTLIT